MDAVTQLPSQTPEQESEMMGEESKSSQLPNLMNMVKLTKVRVLFNHNMTMTLGYGNSRKQAERNASINGLRWLKANKLLEENAASCSGMGVHHNPNESMVPAAFNAMTHQG